MLCAISAFWNSELKWSKFAAKHLMNYYQNIWSSYQLVFSDVHSYLFAV